MRPAYKQKNPTISNVKSLDLWSEWRESNSRPLEPHSSALPKLRYTRISTAASLPKRGDMKYYTQMQQLCQPIFAIFFAFFAKSLIFWKFVVDKACVLRYNSQRRRERNPGRPHEMCGRSSSGRAPPCQGGGSVFEPRRPLHFVEV